MFCYSLTGDIACGRRLQCPLNGTTMNYRLNYCELGSSDYRGSTVIVQYTNYILPSQNNDTSVKLSDLKRLSNAVTRLLLKLFHLRQNCC